MSQSSRRPRSSSPSPGEPTPARGAPGEPSETPEPPSPDSAEPPPPGDTEEAFVTRTARPSADGSDPATVGGFRTVAPASVEDVAQAWSEGQLLADRFRVMRCIGQGGMGKVYLARDEILGRRIALKRVPQEIIFDGDARDDLRHETNRLLDLAHENIIRVHTYYDEPAWPFFAMEYLEGPTLKELLRERRKEERSFSLEELTTIAEQVGEGLGYAHSKGLIHRDLKPANLMLARPVEGPLSPDRDLVKITDFGISRVVADSTLRSTGIRSGTLPYMSPEQYRGEACTVQSDIYSLGATFFELVHGKPPFFSGDIGYQILNLPPRAVESAPRWLNEVLQRALAKEPQDRFEDAAEFVEAFRRRSAYPRGFSLARFARQHARTAALLLVLCFGIYGAFTLNWGHIWTAITDPEGLRGEWVSEEPGIYLLGDGELGELGQLVRQDLEEAEFSQRFLHKQKSFGFEISMQDSQVDLDPLLFNNLIFELKREDGTPLENGLIHGRVKKDENGKPVNALEFLFTVVSDGVYRIVPLINPQTPYGNELSYDGRQNQKALAALGIEEKFKVDTTPPHLAVGPSTIEVDSVFEKSPHHFVTFNSECELSLRTPLSPGDIDRASYRMEIDGQWGSTWEIEEPRFWSITQLRVGTNRFQILARDSAGNETVETVTIERLTIDVINFGLHEHLGNEVVVTGVLDVDDAWHLEELPQLVFFVNGEMVGDLGEAYQTPSLSPDARSFRARLALTSFRNSIEVRYRVGRGNARPFTKDRKIEGLEVEKPAVIVEGFDDPGKILYTRQSVLELRGRIEPYYAGLSVDLERKGLDSPSRIRLRPEPPREPGQRAVATFTEEVWLEPDQNNVIALHAYYDEKNPLWSEPKTFRVYYDSIEPALYNGLEFDLYHGSNLHVHLDPTEALEAARIRRLGETVWEQATLQDEGKYLFITPMPMENTWFEVELEDLAGNTSYYKKLLISPLAPGADEDDPPLESITRVNGRPEPASRHPDSRVEPASYREEDGESSARRADYVATVQRLPELAEYRLQFRPFGDRFEEMATTELPERVWNDFLRETGLGEPPEGSLEVPMTLPESPDLTHLKLFITWFNRKFGQEDGYEYFLPTPEQWRLAFAGSRSLQEAEHDITLWFRRGLKGSLFDPNVDERYGLQRISPIGSRKVNMTPTGLFDMESNLQEVCRGENDAYHVIGGFNRLRSGNLRLACLNPRPLIDTLKDKFGLTRFTGLRLCRQPRLKKP